MCIRRSGRPRGAAATLLRLAVFASIAFALGYFLGTPSSSPIESPQAIEQAAPLWTCSMHPSIRQNRPGKCPICAMDLVPVQTDSAEGRVGLRAFRTSEAAKALMKVETAEAERRFVTKEVRMVGKVAFDETRLGYITAWVPGRLDRLFVDYTGIQVRKGDHMVELYSPELLTAQDELRRAARALDSLRPGAPDALKQTAQTTLEAARRKLNRWGLTTAQIDRAQSEGVVSERITIYAPMGGTVIHRDGREGMYVDQGTRIYTIADLSTVWVKLDAYESDLPWLHYGQRASFTTEAYPGEAFEGRISFIDPVLDAMTRTVKVRVVVKNPYGRLKPEMFVRAVVHAQIATGKRVMDPGLAGKWISPMHPEVIKDEPGPCEVCGMPLVKAEDLGYVPAETTPDDMPLVIPASAPLITGTRAVVYVETPGTDVPTYTGREIVLGPRAGEFYLVESGLEAGERVVTRGAFKIDSALQIQARPSMMMPAGANMATVTEGSGSEMQTQEQAAPRPHDLGLEGHLTAVAGAYLAVMEALAEDDFDRAGRSAQEARAAVDGVDMGVLPTEAHQAWMEVEAPLADALSAMAKADDIEAMRKGIPAATQAVADAIGTIGLSTDESVYRARCPMAFGGKGGDWLQSGTRIRNPYYGSMMLECGEIVGRLAASTSPEEHAEPAEGSHHEGSSNE